MNILAEETEFDIAKRYAVLLNTMFSTAFYAPVMPIALVWGLVAILLHYWAEKFALLRRKVVRHNMST